MPLINALFSDVNPIPVKAAVNMLGFHAGECRLPLDTLDEARKNQLRSLLS
jgi:4-hydroxy-tetrahydrodipicolinate synthase